MRPQGGPLAAPQLPLGFTLRPVVSEEEVGQVRPEFQRQGLGTAVLPGGLHYLQEHAMEAASFMSSSENVAMPSLGAALGFQNSSAIPG